MYCCTCCTLVLLALPTNVQQCNCWWCTEYRAAEEGYDASNDVHSWYDGTTCLVPVSDPKPFFPRSVAEDMPLDLL